MPLSEVNPGKTVKIVGIQGGWGVRQKLLALGIIPGVSVKVIHSGSHSPVVLSVLSNQVMIGYGMARKVMVR